MVLECMYCKSKTNPEEGITLHRLPANEETSEKWMENMGLLNVKAKSHMRLCSKHFDKSCFKKQKLQTVLVSGSLPTIFNEDYRNICVFCKAKKGGNDKMFHKFPLFNDVLLEKWLTNMNLQEFVPTPQSWLCSDHFESTCYRKSHGRDSVRIKVNAVPTIFAKRNLHESPDSPSRNIADSAEGGEPRALKRKRELTDSPSEEVVSLEGSASASDGVDEMSIYLTSQTDELHADLLKKVQQDSIPLILVHSPALDDTGVLQESQGTVEEIDVEIENEDREEESNQVTSSATKEVSSMEAIPEERAPTPTDELDVLPAVAEMLCRICGRKQEHRISMHSPDHESGGMSLLEKIRLHLFLEVELDDGLPQNICFTCYTALNCWHEVFLSCKAAADVLKGCFLNKEKLTETQVAGAPDENDVQVENGSNSEEPEAMEAFGGGDDNHKDDPGNPEEDPANHADQDDQDEDESFEWPLTEPEFPPDTNTLALEGKNHYYRCRYCLCSFEDRDKLKVHRLECERSTFLCQICGELWPRRRTSLRHQSKHESTVQERAQSLKFQCDTCGRLFLTKANLYGHQFTHKQHACDVCSKVCPSRHLLLVHRLTHNYLPRLYCDVCFRIYNTPKSLRLHKRKDKEKGQEPIFDVLCDKLHDISGGVKFSCRECGVVCASKLILAAHVNVPKKVICVKCRTTFANERAKLIHECTGIPKDTVSFTQRPIVKNLSNVFFKCRFCAKKLQSTFGVWYHENKHLGVRPYKCRMCDESFASSSQRQSHEDGHGMNIYTCEVCGKVFRKHSRFKYHVEIHKNLNYSCHICDKKFLVRQNLYRHKIKVHKISAKY